MNAPSAEQIATLIEARIVQVKVATFNCQSPHSERWYALQAHQAVLVRKWRELKTLESVV